TLADTNEEAANSQALSTRQSIATSALSLANQSQQSVPQLLRASRRNSCTRERRGPVPAVFICCVNSCAVTRGPGPCLRHRSMTKNSGGAHTRRRSHYGDVFD